MPPLSAEAVAAEDRAGADAVAMLDRCPNLVELFFARAAERADRPFLFRKEEGRWRAITWRDAALRVARIAAALRHHGLKPGDRVVLVSENRPEFCLFDLGIMAAGGVSVPTYTTNSVRDHQHILDDSRAVLAIVSTAKLARPLIEAALRSAATRLVVTMDDAPVLQAPDAVRLLAAAQFLEGIEGDVPTTRRAVRAGRDDLACLIYTSGTGGAPRGVRQHHGAILHNLAGCAAIIGQDFPPIAGPERFLSFLPLSHAYEHTAGQFLPIALGGEIFYAESLEKLAANIAEARPTVMVVVPRLFEVLRTRITREINGKGGLARRMMAAALARQQRARGHDSTLGRAGDFLLEHLFRRKVRAKFGGALRAMVSGGAPLNADVALFFQAVGLTVLQGYGETEAGPVISCNRPGAGIRAETVGPPLRGVKLRIADDGEILVQGELVMHGYWNNPEETARVLAPDGWLKTGDIGRIDKDGHLVITDRKKDILVNDKGDNIAPQKVEGLLTLQDEIAQAMIYGDRRPYLVGLVVPDEAFAAAFAAKAGIDPAALAADDGFRRAVQAAVDRVSQRLAPHEKVRRILLADEPFAIDNGEMTPSLKIRRHMLVARYGPRLDALYRA